MRRSFVSLAILCTLIAFSSMAEAQPGGGRPGGGRPGGGPGGFRGGFGGGPGGFRGGPGGGQMSMGQLLGIEQVQKEIKLDGDKLEAVNKVLEEARSARGGFGDFGNIRELSEEERQKAFAKMREDAEKRNKETDSQLTKLLSQEQATRVKQIQLQLMGVRALDDDDVVKKLDLSEDQQLEIAEVFEAEDTARGEMFEKLRSAGREGGQEAFQKMREDQEKLQSETKTKALAVLNASQKSTFDSMTGKPFELDREAMMRGFGGGRGRGGFGGGRPGGGRPDGEGGGRRRGRPDSDDN